MIVKMSGENFKLLYELFTGIKENMACIDKPKEANAYNASAIDVSYFRPKPRFRLVYNGEQGVVVIPDEVIIEA